MHRSQDRRSPRSYSPSRTDHRYVALVMVVSTCFSLFLFFSPRRPFLFLSLCLLPHLALSCPDRLPPLSPYRRADRGKEVGGGRRPEKRGKTRTRSERESCRGLGDKLIVDVRHAPPPPLALSLFPSLCPSSDRQTDRPADRMTPSPRSASRW